MVTTSDPDLAERLPVIRVHGAKPKYYHEIIGGSSRLDALQAAVLLVKLKHLDRWHQDRRENPARDGPLFEARGLEELVTLPASIHEERGSKFPHIYNQYVIRASRRDALRQHLAARGVSTAVYYPVPLHRQACLAHLGYCEGSLPESERAAREVWALLVYPGITPSQQEHVVDSIEQYYRRRNSRVVVQYPKATAAPKNCKRNFLKGEMQSTSSSKPAVVTSRSPKSRPRTICDPMPCARATSSLAAGPKQPRAGSRRAWLVHRCGAPVPDGQSTRRGGRVCPGVGPRIWRWEWAVVSSQGRRKASSPVPRV